MTKMYTVWVGGIPDFTTADPAEARKVQREWWGEGYEDVTLETWYTEKENK